MIGFWAQRTNNASHSTDNSFTANGFWAYLFGVRPRKERLYLRVATLQALGLAYLAFAATTVWFWDAKTVRWVGLSSFVLGLMVVGLFWAVANLFGRRKH